MQETNKPANEILAAHAPDNHGAGISSATEQWLQKGDQAIQAVASQVKTSAGDILEAVQHTTDQGQDKAKQLIRTLKHNFEQWAQTSETALTSTSKPEPSLAPDAQSITSALTPVTKAIEQEVEGLQSSLQHSIRQHPVTSVLVAAGAGLLVGYLLSKQPRE